MLDTGTLGTAGLAAGPTPHAHLPSGAIPASPTHRSRTSHGNSPPTAPRSPLCPSVCLMLCPKQGCATQSYPTASCAPKRIVQNSGGRGETQTQLRAPREPGSIPPRHTAQGPRQHAQTDETPRAQPWHPWTHLPTAPGSLCHPLPDTGLLWPYAAQGGARQPQLTPPPLGRAKVRKRKKKAKAKLRRALALHGWGWGQGLGWLSMGSGILGEQGWGCTLPLATTVAPLPTASQLLLVLARRLAPPQLSAPHWGPRALPGGAEVGCPTTSSPAWVAGTR